MIPILLQLVYFVTVISCLRVNSVSSSPEVIAAIDNKLGNLRHLGGDNHKKSKNHGKKKNKSQSSSVSASSSSSSSTSSNTSSSSSTSTSSSGNSGSNGVDEYGGRASTSSETNIVGKVGGLLVGASIIVVGIYAASVAFARPKEKHDKGVSRFETIARKVSTGLNPGASKIILPPEMSRELSRYRIMNEDIILASPGGVKSVLSNETIETTVSDITDISYGEPPPRYRVMENGAIRII